MDVDEDEVRRLRARIQELTKELEQRYDERALLLAEQCRRMTQRKAAAMWGMAQPAVVYALRRAKGKSPHRRTWRAVGSGGDTELGA